MKNLNFRQLSKNIRFFTKFTILSIAKNQWDGIYTMKLARISKIVNKISGSLVNLLKNMKDFLPQSCRNRSTVFQFYPDQGHLERRQPFMRYSNFWTHNENKNSFISIQVLIFLRWDLDRRRKSPRSLDIRNCVFDDTRFPKKNPQELLYYILYTLKYTLKNQRNLKC